MANSSGWRCHTLEPTEASRLFSVEVDSGKVKVNPDIPLFLRVPGPTPIRKSFVDTFLFGEATGTLWAAGGLMKSPCVNRPSYQGLAGLCSQSSSSTQSRAGLSPDDVEMFFRDLGDLKASRPRKWGIQDTITLETAVYPRTPDGSGPYRARPIPEADGSYEIVVVVGARAWRVSEAALGHLQLEEKSVRILERLALTFGAVTWSVYRNGRAANLARVDPYPPFEFVHRIWNGVGGALLEALTL